LQRPELHLCSAELVFVALNDLPVERTRVPHHPGDVMEAAKNDGCPKWVTVGVVLQKLAWITSAGRPMMEQGLQPQLEFGL
jgi:hypothetical protein